MGWKCKLVVIVSLLCSGCYRNHLYVQQEYVDRNFLASSHVNTPDPRQSDPPEGQRLLVGWNFSRCMMDQEPSFVISMRFWDDTDQEIVDIIPRKRGSRAYDFPKKKILTYRVQVVSKDGEILETWQHHFWTEKIEVK
jgi:hypothetical protein